MKLGILINKNFVNTEKIKKFLYKLKQNENFENFEIIIFDRNIYVDREIIKILNQFNINFKKFKPYYLNYDSNCIEIIHKFNQKYQTKYLFAAFSKFIKYISTIIIFNFEIEDTIIEYFKNNYNKINKNIKVINYENN